MGPASVADGGEPWEVLIVPQSGGHPADLDSFVDRAGGLRLWGVAPLAAELALADVRFPVPGRVGRWILLRHRGDLVAGAYLTRRRAEPTAAADVLVDPAWRGRGLGRRMLTAARVAAGDVGLTALRFKAPVNGPGARLLARYGRPAGTGQRLRLSLAQLPPDGFPGSPDTPCLTWEGPTPPGLSPRPAGGLPVETAATRAERDRSWQATGYRWFSAAVLERPSGAVVAFSQLVISPRMPDVGFVCGTVTDARHRRAGLATTVKAGAARHAMTADTGLRQLVTFNAADNPAIGRLNAGLGFRPTEEIGFWDVACGDNGGRRPAAARNPVAAAYRS